MWTSSTKQYCVSTTSIRVQMKFFRCFKYCNNCIWLCPWIFALTFPTFSAFPLVFDVDSWSGLPPFSVKYVCSLQSGGLQKAENRRKDTNTDKLFSKRNTGGLEKQAAGGDRSSKNSTKKGSWTTETRKVVVRGLPKFRPSPEMQIWPGMVLGKFANFCSRVCFENIMFCRINSAIIN